ncbi:unnamed protein product, partial [Medioppia subpectinata]
MSGCLKGQRTGPGYKSPTDAISGRPETLMYVTCVQPNGLKDQKPDFLATVDVNPQSDTYCRVISRAVVSHFGDELHHSGWNSCSSCFCDPNKVRDKMICPALNSDRIYIFDMSSPKEPKLFKTIENDELYANKVSSGHTSHCLPSGEVMISTMGDEKRLNKGSFILLDGKTFNLKSQWNRPEDSVQFGYDFWYQPNHNVMISTEWSAPETVRRGFNLDDVRNGLYGHCLHVWNWSSRQYIQKIDLGSDGMLPLEIRFLHNPNACEGFVGCALSSTVFRFFKSGDKWEAEKVLSIPTKRVTNWITDDMPALITDILISLDDKYLYLSLWFLGEIRQYDISNTSSPVLVGKCCFGGILSNNSLVKEVGNTETDSNTERVFVQQKHIKGGPQMLQLSLDGRRLYVTNSLYSVWDKQFFPDMVAEGSVDKGVVGGGSRQYIQKIDLGSDGMLPLEIRFLHNPNACEDDMPALITDILISLDDKYLYLSLWFLGEIRQYDISNTSSPVFVGKCCFGGILSNNSLVKEIGNTETDGNTERVFVQQKHIKGGPQMLQLSLDGKRLYVTNSLYSVWDKQFFPDMVAEGS